MCVTPRRQDILDRLHASAAGCRQLTEALLAQEQLRPQAVTAFVRSYIGHKFLCPSPPDCGESLYDLGQAAYLRQAQLQRQGGPKSEINTGCSGATTAMARKALLFMALQRDLRLTLSPDEITWAETVGDAAALCINHLCKE